MNNNIISSKYILIYQKRHEIFNDAFSIAIIKMGSPNV